MADNIVSTVILRSVKKRARVFREPRTREPKFQPIRAFAEIDLTRTWYQSANTLREQFIREQPIYEQSFRDKSFCEFYHSSSWQKTIHPRTTNLRTIFLRILSFIFLAENNSSVNNQSTNNLSANFIIHLLGRKQFNSANFIILQTNFCDLSSMNYTSATFPQ